MIFYFTCLNHSNVLYTLHNITFTILLRETRLRVQEQILSQIYKWSIDLGIFYPYTVIL